MRRLVSALALCPLMAVPALVVPAAQAAVPVTVTFSYNGTDGSDGRPQSWTVPSGVHEATFVVDGASGAGSGAPSGEEIGGGHGARMVATLTVTPGTTYTLLVGGQAPTGFSAVGGYNGGGGVPFTAAGGQHIPGGGGGATEVLSAADATERLIVAGGGGGAGGSGTGFYEGVGGVGGDAGAPGMQGETLSVAAGGAPGQPGCTAPGIPADCGHGGAGGAGSYLAGAAGGDADGGDGGSPGDFDTQVSRGGGGGGGGGWEGGGAGGGGGFGLNAEPRAEGAGGGGGGGGSSFVTPAAVSSSPAVPRTDHGHGRVSVTFVSPDPDTDADGVVDADDSCVSLASAHPTGCPVLSRRGGIGYAPLRQRFEGGLRSPEHACVAHRQVTLWRATSGQHRRLASTVTGADGRWTLPRAFRFGAGYYVRAAPVLLPDTGLCQAVRSITIKRVRG